MQGEAIIRTKIVCDKHFNILQRDNFYRYKKDIQIEANLLFFKRCFFYRCAKKFLRDFENLPEAESVEFCSTRCIELEDVNREAYEKR